MAVAIVGCPSAADAAEEVVDIVLYGNNLEELNEGRLSGDSVWADGVMLGEAEEGGEFRGPNHRAGAGETVIGNGDERILRKFERA